MADGIGGHAGELGVGRVPRWSKPPRRSACAAPASRFCCPASRPDAGDANGNFRRIGASIGNTSWVGTRGGGADLFWQPPCLRMVRQQHGYYLVRDGVHRPGRSQIIPEIGDVIETAHREKRRGTWRQRNVITRAIGVFDDPELETAHGEGLCRATALFVQRRSLGHESKRTKSAIYD